MGALSTDLSTHPDLLERDIKLGEISQRAALHVVIVGRYERDPASVKPRWRETLDALYKVLATENRPGIPNEPTAAKLARRAAGLTVQDVAQRSGHGLDDIIKYENNPAAVSRSRRATLDALYRTLA